MSNAEHTQSLASAVATPAHPSRRVGGTEAPSTRSGARRALAAAGIWGAAVGVIQAAAPLGFWWLELRTVYALGLTLIAAVYIGFSVADGRWHVIAAECCVAGIFVVVAAVSVSGPAWLIVLGLAGHGLKDLWQHRTQFVRNTRWWPPFCATVDWVAAGILTTAMLMGFPLHG